MELGTFGAILRFALDWEAQVATFYEQAARGSWSEEFRELARGARKRLERLERARREGIAEMILEPIVGLQSDPYWIDTVPHEEELGLLRQALSVEEKGQRFYREAGSKLPIREVARLFEQLAEDNGTRAERVRHLIGGVDPCGKS
jgi:rubrerythrin